MLSRPRRYHWLSESLQSFVDEPHAAIDGIEQGVIVNLTDRKAAASRQGQLDILGTLGRMKSSGSSPVLSGA